MTTEEETVETTEETTPDGEVQDPENSTDETVEPEEVGAGQPEEVAEEEPETFPKEYVVKLRDEAAKYRTRAGRADALAERLHTSLVAATGRLADPSDLPFEEGHLDDEEAITTAIDELLNAKPHLASRKPTGDIGQGASASGDTVDLAGILRSRA